MQNEKEKIPLNKVDTQIEWHYLFERFQFTAQQKGSSKLFHIISVNPGRLINCLDAIEGSMGDIADKRGVECRRRVPGSWEGLGRVIIGETNLDGRVPSIGGKGTAIPVEVSGVLEDQGL